MNYTAENGKTYPYKDAEHAKKVLANTATVWCMTKEEILSCEEFQEIAKHFGFKIDDIKSSPGEHWMDYATHYYF